MSSGPGRRQFLQAVEATVFGVDVDAEAVARARNVVRTVATTISPGPLPPLWFSRNVAVADFLFDDVSSALGLSEAPVSIVGNPPYVTTTRLDPVHKRRLRLRFATAHGRLDLYTLFIERAAELLAPNGRLAFITPDKFLVSKSAAPLRTWLLERGALIRVSTFDEHDAFRGAATVPCVTGRRVLSSGRLPFSSVRPVAGRWSSDGPHSSPLLTCRAACGTLGLRQRSHCSGA